MKEIPVRLGERSHSIFLGYGMVNSLPDLCRRHDIPLALSIITDRNVARQHLRPVRNVLRHHGFNVLEVVISPGEHQKSFSRASGLVSRLLKANRSRSSAILALGGGVVGDLAGFVAAVFRRGIPFIQVPTTLLADVESSLGGKVAVNHPLGKNAMGAFHQPAFILTDIAFLTTLPKREWICGLGEVVKYGMLDPGILQFLETHLDQILRPDLEIVEELVRRCNTCKVRLIEEDERETNPSGGRSVLNLGHTIGHALEQLSQYRLHHGEAVLLGLRWELRIARESSTIGADDCARLSALLDRIPFHPPLRGISAKAVRQILIPKTGVRPFVLPRAVGTIATVRDISEELVDRVLATVFH